MNASEDNLEARVDAILAELKDIKPQPDWLQSRLGDWSDVIMRMMLEDMIDDEELERAMNDLIR
jgi:hypothetical protein